MPVNRTGVFSLGMKALFLVIGSLTVSLILNKGKDLIMKKLVMFLILVAMVGFAFVQKSYADPENWFDSVNYFRGMVNLPEVVENNTLSDECKAAAKVIAFNYYDLPDNWHALGPELKHYSDGAAKAASESILFGGGIGTEGDAIEGWMQTVYHALPIINPYFYETGFGFYTHGGVQGACLNIYGGKTYDSLPPDFDWPMFFPPNRSFMWKEQRQFADEVPTPLDHCPASYKDVVNGRPIILGTGSSVGDVNNITYSVKENGVNLEACRLTKGNNVVIIPKNVLKSNKDYEVSVNVMGNTYKWSFTTWPTKLWGNIIWYHPFGLFGVWIMDGSTLNEEKSHWIGFIPEPLSADWRIVETVDLNNDGSTDILARNITTSENAVVFMDGGEWKEFKYLEKGYNSDWDIVGTGDFNKDGRKDIIWRNRKTGGNRIWLMDGIKTYKKLTLSGTDPEWKIVGTGHFKGGEDTDILWQNTTTGRIALWYMDGTEFKGQIAEIGFVNAPWEVASTVDMNGDNKPDILLRDPVNGWNAVWYMDNNIVTSWEYLPLVQIPGMTIIGTGNFE